MMLNRNTHTVEPRKARNNKIMSWVLVLYIFMLSSPLKVLWAQEPAEINQPESNPVIVFYQAHISGIDGNRCAMYPNCSRYCIQAIQKHGFGLGWIMACDRLLRCGRDEIRMSPHVRINGRELTFDPVSANDFWWFSPKASAIENNLPKEKLYHSDPGWMSDLNPDQQE